jgi:alcohol dehydrogenase, propanol-preferring
MRAAVLQRLGEPLELVDRSLPVPQGDEVLVRVLGTGVCRSDVHLSGGLYPDLPVPLILGHEIAGEAEGIGPVLVYGAWGCGSCALCARGEDQLCPDRRSAGWRSDGGFAEYVVVPHPRFLLPLDGLDPVRAAPLADAGVTPYRAVRRAREWLGPGETALVFGAGALGQFAIQYLELLTEAHVIAVDPVAAKRERARTLGAEETAAPEDELPSARVVLDFVGTEETMSRALRTVQLQGLYLLIGEAGGQVPIGFELIPGEAHFSTVRWGSISDQRMVLDLAHSGKLDWLVEPLPLERANEALGRLRQGDTMGRLVLVP